MTHSSDLTDGYRVEVSGWDAKEAFFVEKTLLDWEGEGKKEIALRNSLKEGAVIFVRLLQTVANSHNFPIAYQATTIGERDSGGRMRVGLERLRPRAAYKDTIDLAFSATVKVA
jgi:hypothetical protein